MPVLGALGTIVLDRIFPPPADEEKGSTPGGDPLEDWGGLLYALESLEVAREEGWSFLPLAKVGEDVFEPAADRVGSLPGVVGLEGLRHVPEPNNRVELRYHDAGDRCERLEGGVPGWTWKELAPLAARCDALYLNFIAGWELDLDAARELRRHFGGPVYCDVHSLLLGVDTSGVRVRRALPQRDAWIECFDWIQGNEPEIALVAGREDPLEAVRALVDRGVDAAFCTLGVAGAAWATAGDAGRFDIADAPEIARDGALHTGRATDRPPDPTGCGDVWGAACAAGLVAGRAVPDAVRRANRFGAAASAHRGTSGLADALRRFAPAGDPAA